MIIVDDDLWLCEDCTAFACSGDLSAIDYYLSGNAAESRAREVTEGVASLGPHLVPDFDGENGIEKFSHRHCDACGEHLAGSRLRFAVLGPDSQRDPTVPCALCREPIPYDTGVSDT